MADDPIALFDRWFADAAASEPNDPNAMALATVDADGCPSVRIVLLKSVDDGDFTFHTNGLSRKGAELDCRPAAALCFHWKSLRRQVRVEGPVSHAPDAESDAYFATRGRDSQLSAWASLQSQPLATRDMLLERMDEMRARFAEGEVPRPPHWHGYRLRPERIEFWEDGEHRLHHRRLFTRAAAGGWDEGLLFP